MRVAAALLLMACLASVATAGSKGKWVGILTDYADLKERTLKTVQQADDLRREGRFMDSKIPAAIWKEAVALNKELSEIVIERRRATTEGDDVDLAGPVLLSQALRGLSNILEVEVNYQLQAGLIRTAPPRLPELVELEHKYLEAWRTLDAALPRAPGQ